MQLCRDAIFCVSERMSGFSPDFSIIGLIRKFCNVGMASGDFLILIIGSETQNVASLQQKKAPYLLFKNTIHSPRDKYYNAHPQYPGCPANTRLPCLPALVFYF